MEKVQGARIADLDRKKYLVPGDLTGERGGHMCTSRHYLTRVLPRIMLVVVKLWVKCNI